MIATKKIHEQYGGVVPELASRAHMQHIVPVVDQAMQQSGKKLADIDAVAFTKAPGLIGSLLVGAQFAKSMALSLGIPVIGCITCRHMCFANLIGDQTPAFPFLCLTVSGGHTQIVECRSPTDLHILGQTQDDAAGEAFDKTAKNAGTAISRWPIDRQIRKIREPLAYHFPEPQVAGLDFSFSGLKTSILYFLQNAGRSMLYREKMLATEDERLAFIQNRLADICASVQYRIVSILLHKLKMASQQTGITRICLAGG